MWIQNVLGWLKIGLIGFMVLNGIAVLFTRPRNAEVWRRPLENSNLQWNTLSTALFKVIYSYAGLENVNNVMNEVRNPVRTIKTVGPAGLLTTGIMYVLVNLAYLSVVPVEEIKESRELVAALFFERLQYGRWALPIGIALSAIGNVMVVRMGTLRLLSQATASTPIQCISRGLKTNACAR